MVRSSRLRPVDAAVRFAGVLLDWRGTLAVAPTGAVWYVETALRRLGRQQSGEQVRSVVDQLHSVDHREIASSAIDTDSARHRAAYAAWFEAADIDSELAAELYAVESDATLNPFASDVGPLLRTLHAAGVRVGVVSDIHFDLRPLFAASQTRTAAAGPT